MSSSLREFQEALLVRRVVARHLDRVAMEHPTEEAKKTYLKEHPNADPSNHTVKKNEGGGGKGGDLSGDAAKASARSKETTKHFEEIKDLKKKVENADPAAKKKLDKAYDKLYESGESAAKSAEKLLKKLDDVEGKEAQSAVKLLHSAVKDWEHNKINHHRNSGGMAGAKVQQAEQSWAYAKQIDDKIEMLSKALKGDYD